MTGASDHRIVGVALRAAGALLLVGATVVAFVETKANGLNCGSAIVPAPLKGGALLSGDLTQDDITLAIIRADCSRLVTRQRLATGGLAAAGVGALWWSRRHPIEVRRGAH